MCVSCFKAGCEKGKGALGHRAPSPLGNSRFIGPLQSPPLVGKFADQGRCPLEAMSVPLDSALGPQAPGVPPGSVCASAPDRPPGEGGPETALLAGGGRGRRRLRAVSSWRLAWRGSGWEWGGCGDWEPGRPVSPPPSRADAGRVRSG